MIAPQACQADMDFILANTFIGVVLSRRDANKCFDRISAHGGDRLEAWEGPDTSVVGESHLKSYESLKATAKQFRRRDKFMA
ncbi:hypothetical protein GCM10009069_12620 [Algimonas arctica]|uniref:Uncharacterized protein n=1 Tax=Algimonas arctica TaxID=1479486 RepID=A0A8J3CPP4_9PROT|nr:hypothetical protein GCM10009069_12620 [Algimonas arctica]